MIHSYDINCPLCRLVNDGEVLTRVLLETDLVLVTLCSVCLVPMAVLKSHIAAFNENEKQKIRIIFKHILSIDPLPMDTNSQVHPLPANIKKDHDSKKLPWVIDWEQRQIPSHAHCHLRPFAFCGTNHWERLLRDNS